MDLGGGPAMSMDLDALALTADALRGYFDGGFLSSSSSDELSSSSSSEDEKDMDLNADAAEVAEEEDVSMMPARQCPSVATSVTTASAMGFLLPPRAFRHRHDTAAARMRTDIETFAAQMEEELPTQSEETTNVEMVLEVEIAKTAEEEDVPMIPLLSQPDDMTNVKTLEAQITDTEARREAAEERAVRAEAEVARLHEEVRRLNRLKTTTTTTTFSSVATPLTAPTVAELITYCDEHIDDIEAEVRQHKFAWDGAPMTGDGSSGMIFSRNDDFWRGVDMRKKIFAELLDPGIDSKEAALVFGLLIVASLRALSVAMDYRRFVSVHCWTTLVAVHPDRTAVRDVFAYALDRGGSLDPAESRRIREKFRDAVETVFGGDPLEEPATGVFNEVYLRGPWNPDDVLAELEAIVMEADDHEAIEFLGRQRRAGASLFSYGGRTKGSYEKVCDGTAIVKRGELAHTEKQLPSA